MKALLERIGQAEGSSLLDFPIGSIPPYSISAIGGTNNQVLALVNGKASWSTIEDLTGETDSPSITIPTIQRGDLLSAEDSSTLTTIHAIGGSKFLVTDNANEHSIYRRITAADVDAGTFPGLTYNMGSVSTTKTIGFFLNSLGTDPTIVMAELTGVGLTELYAGLVRITIAGNFNTNFSLRNARGTIATPLYSTAAFGNVILFQGYDESISSYVQGAYIDAFPVSTWSATNREMQIGFATTPSGSLTPIQRWIVKSSGVFGPAVDNSYDIGTIAFRPKTIYGYTGDYTTRVTSPLFGTVTNVNTVIDRNSITKITIGTSSVVFVDPIYAPEGAVGAPSYSFGGGTTDGFYHTTAPDVRLALGGALIYTFASGLLTMSASLRFGADNIYSIGTGAVYTKEMFSYRYNFRDGSGTALFLGNSATISDGQYLKRSGTEIIGDTLTVADVGDITGPLVGDFLLMGA